MLLTCTLRCSSACWTSRGKALPSELAFRPWSGRCLVLVRLNVVLSVCAAPSASGLGLQMFLSGRGARQVLAPPPSPLSLPAPGDGPDGGRWVEEDEPPDPVDISLFGADGIVFEADSIAHPIQELLASMANHLGKVLTLGKVMCSIVMSPNGQVVSIGFSVICTSQDHYTEPFRLMRLSA